MPEGDRFGAILFKYMHILGEKTVHVHCYVDDTQLYLLMKSD